MIIYRIFILQHKEIIYAMSKRKKKWPLGSHLKKLSLLKHETEHTHLLKPKACEDILFSKINFHFNHEYMCGHT